MVCTRKAFNVAHLTVGDKTELIECWIRQQKVIEENEIMRADVTNFPICSFDILC